MSRKFTLVKSYYDNGMWNKEMVRNAVSKGWITAEEFEMITGDKY
ncbi:MAG: XkdX family protein [Eubacteriales bacterium]|nr:XkdX family protein [Eubacteriales bacterium]